MSAMTMTAISRIDCLLKNPFPRGFLAAGGMTSGRAGGGGGGAAPGGGGGGAAPGGGGGGGAAPDGGGGGGGRSFSVGTASGGCLRALICSVGGSGGGPGR